MNSAQYVSNLLEELKKAGTALMVIAWKIALACVGWAYVFGARGQYCTPANRRARYSDAHPTIKTACKNYNGSGSEGCKGCKWYPGNLLTRFFDCRGFPYWIFKIVYGFEIMGAGATSQWDTKANWRAQGTIDTCPDDIIVCLFQKDKNKKSTMAHTGIGFHGETVECQNGVQHFAKRKDKWTHWAIPACVEMEGQPMPDKDQKEDPKGTEPTLRKGSKGDWVKKLQSELITLGYSCGSKGADGIYGNDTFNAVKAFQKASGLKADGIAGPKTWEALNAAQKPPEKPKTYTVTVTGCTKAVADEIVSKYGGKITEEP